MNKIINKNRIIYLLSTIGGRLYVLFTIPLITKYLSKDDFGFYMILMQVVILIQNALLVLFSNGLLKFMVDTPEEKKKRFMGTILSTFLVVEIFIVLILFIFYKELFGVLFPNITQQLEPTIFYAILWLFIISLRSFFITFIQLLEKSKLVLFHIVVYGLLLIFILNYQLIYLNVSVSGVMLSFFLADILAILILIIPSIKYFCFCFNYQYLKKFMKFSLPLIGGSFLAIAFSNIDRVVLAQYVSLEDMGVYGIGFMFGSLAGMIVSANISAFTPRVKKIMASGDLESVKKISTHYLNEVQDLMLIVIVTIALFSNIIIQVLASKYLGSLASIIMIGIAIGHLARSYYIFFEQILFLKDKVNSIFVIKIISMLLGLFSSFILAKYFGIVGVAYLWSIVFIVISLIAFKYIKKYNLIQIKLFKNFVIFIGIILLVFSELVVLQDKSYFYYIVKFYFTYIKHNNQKILKGFK